MILQDYIYAEVMIPVGLIYTFIIVFIWLFGLKTSSFHCPGCLNGSICHSSGCEVASWSRCCAVVSGWCWPAQNQAAVAQNDNFLTRVLKRAAVASSQLCLGSSRAGWKDSGTAREDLAAGPSGRSGSARVVWGLETWRISVVTWVELTEEVMWCFCTFAKRKRLAEGLHYVLFVERYLEILENLHLAKYMIS